MHHFRIRILTHTTNNGRGGYACCSTNPLPPVGRDCPSGIVLIRVAVTATGRNLLLSLCRHQNLTVPYDHVAFLDLRWRVVERFAQRVLFQGPEGGLIRPVQGAQILRAVVTLIIERGRQAASEGRVELDGSVLPDYEAKLRQPRHVAFEGRERKHLPPKESRSGKANEGANESVLLLLLLLESELKVSTEWVGACCAGGGVTEAAGTKKDVEEERETGRRVAQWIMPVRGSSCSSNEVEEESAPPSLGVGRRTNPDTDDSTSEAVSAALTLQEICPS